MTCLNSVARLTLLLALAILTLSVMQAAAQTPPKLPRITQAVDASKLVVLRGSVHPLAQPQFDQGAIADAQPLDRMLLLLQRSPEQEAALQRLLDDQQSKSSANYRAWLTPEEFGQLFGPADTDIQAVTTWLQSQGFQVTQVTKGRTVIEFSGNGGQVRNAFHTEIHRFLVDGEEHTANNADPQIPAALAPVVAGVVSLHNFPRKSYARLVGLVRRTSGKAGLEPLFTFPIPPTGRSFYGLGPGDFATIYNTKPLIAAGNDGTGQIIAVVGESNINVQDVQRFRKMFGLPANFDATNVILNGEDPGLVSSGLEAEADLDVEWSGAVAPGATVKFVVSASTPASAGVDLSALYIVEHNLAGVMSESFGDCERNLGQVGNQFYNSLWEQAAAQGITVILASGDGGSAGCDNFDRQQPATQGLAVSGLASTPFNVSVGGIDFDQVNNWAAYWNPTNDPTGTSAKTYIPEIPWSDNCAQIGLTGCDTNAPSGSVNIVAGSGGPSSIYRKPTWQMGVTGVPNDDHRDQPDVSLFASPGFDGTGYVYCQSDRTLSHMATCDLNASSGVLNFGIVGGTSASAPAFAGIMALVNQYQATHGGSNRQGNANYVLYALANRAGASCTSSATQTAGCVFNDVTKGNSALPTGGSGVGTNSVPCQGGSHDCSVELAGSRGVLVDPNQTTTEAWTATAGYDMTTGLGTVNANNLAATWSSVSTTPTTTTLALSPTGGITHGTSENVTVGVTVKPNAGTAVPNGDVSLIATFPDGTTQGLDHFPLAIGAVSGAMTQSLPGGGYTVSAHYAGDGTNAPSDSTAVPVTVGKENSKIFLVVPTFDWKTGQQTNGNASSFSYGLRALVRAYVTNSAGIASPTGPPAPLCHDMNPLTCPTGTVTLTDNNGAPLDAGTYNMNNDGYTRDLSSSLRGGTHQLSATYSGDASYNGSSTSDTITITPAPTTAQLSMVQSPVVLGSPIPLYLTVNASVPGVAPTGTVTFYYDGNNPLPLTSSVFTSGTPGIPPLGAAAFLANATGVLNTGGKHTITANYSGDANYQASTSSAATIQVLYPTTTTQSESATTIPYGQSITVTANVTTSNQTPPLSGQIQFFASYTPINGPITPTLTTDAKGNQVMTATVTTTPQFNESIAVSYTGDPNYAVSGTSGQFITVNIPGFTLPQNTVMNVVAGQTGTATMTVTPTSTTPSQVKFAVQSLVPVGSTLTLTPSLLSLNGAPAAVTYTLTTTLPSGAATSTAPAARALVWKASPMGGLGNANWPPAVATILAFVLLAAMPGRRHRDRLILGVGFLALLSVVLGCGSVGSSGVAPPPPPPPVPVSTTTTLTTAYPKIAAGSPVTLTAKVSSTNPVTGLILLYDGGNQINLGTVVAGQVVFSQTFFDIGTHVLTAHYAGDSLNNPSQTATAVNQVITGSLLVVITGQTGGLQEFTNLTINLQ